MRKDRLPFLIIGVALLAFFLFMALFPGVFTDMDRKESFGAWLPMSEEHILGTNSLGYDIFTELVYGARDTLLVGLASGFLSVLIGAVVGLLSAAKGVVGVVFGGITDIFAMLPRLVMLIVISAFLQGSSASLILLISVFGWAGTAREVRAKVVHVRALPFVETCKMYGYGRVHTAVRHILPNVSDVLLSRFLVGVTTCIMTESTMSFLGFGDLYYPTWGVMIDFARSRGALIAGAYQYLLAPCVCIMLLALSFYLISLYIEKRREVVSPAVFNR